jgi:prevent-host-death family protein
MREREPMTKTMKASEARQQWSELLNQVFRGETRVLVEKSGIPVAAIVSAKDLERLKQLEEQREEDFKALEATRQAFKDVPEEEIEREVTRAISAIRAQNRRREQRDAPTP